MRMPADVVSGLVVRELELEVGEVAADGILSSHPSITSVPVTFNIVSL